ncbi:MAG: hypothetical protein ABI199_08745 [Bacteroidia bacterium]
MQKTVLIICRNHLAKAPRFIMEVNALKSQYTILAAGLSGDTSKNASYQFIDIRNSIKKPQNINITFHHHWISPFRKIVSLFIHLFFNSSMNYEKKIMDYEFNLLKKNKFELVIVHHLSALPLAIKLAAFKKVKVIFNAHEYYPREFEDSANWIKFEQPGYLKICEEYLSKISALFVVCKSIGEEYEKQFGVKSVVVKNSKPFQQILPSQVTGDKIRIIHHGAAIRSRGLEVMVQMMDFLPSNFELYLMLMETDLNYYKELKTLAATYKNIYFVPTVSTNNIANEINKYDIGCFVLQPNNFNYLNALPNKLFEFIQARLALAISPSPEMAAIVKQYDLGVVAKEFTAESMAEELKKISVEKIMYYKNQCHKYAQELSSEEDEKIISETVNELLIKQD